MRSSCKMDNAPFCSPLDVLRAERKRTGISFYCLIAECGDERLPDDLAPEIAYRLIGPDWHEVPIRYLDNMAALYAGLPTEKRQKRLRRIPVTRQIRATLLKHRDRTGLNYADITHRLPYSAGEFTAGRISQWVTGAAKWANEEHLHSVLETYWNNKSCQKTIKQ